MIVYRSSAGHYSSINMSKIIAFGYDMEDEGALIENWTLIEVWSIPSTWEPVAYDDTTTWTGPTYTKNS